MKLTAEQRLLFPMAALLKNWHDHCDEVHDGGYGHNVVFWHEKNFPECDAGLSVLLWTHERELLAS